jgi:hypothetical protein
LGAVWPGLGLEDPGVGGLRVDAGAEAVDAPEGGGVGCPGDRTGRRGRADGGGAWWDHGPWGGRR